MRVATSVALTAVVATTLSACAFITPQQTTRSYTPSDGVNGHVGDVKIRNVLLITANGEDASLIGVLSNDSDSAQDVTVQYDTVTGVESQQIAVPANGFVSLRPSDTEPTASVPADAASVALRDIDAPLGGLYSIGFSTGSGDPVSLRVPVLPPSLQPYTTLTPTSTPTPTPTPTPTDSAVPSDTGSATPSESASPAASETAQPTETATP